jgi:hypothetical protein
MLRQVSAEPIMSDTPTRDQLQIVDRGRGHLGGRADIGQSFVEDLGEASTVRVVDAAGPAGRDREEPARTARCAVPARAHHTAQHNDGDNAAGHGGILQSTGVSHRAA